MIYANFVTLYLDTTVYLTDFHRNIDYNGNTYVAGYLNINQPVRQKAEPSSDDFSITLSGVDQVLTSLIAGSNYKGRRCLIERVEFNDNETVSDSKVWLDGDLDKYSFTNDNQKSIIKLTAGSIFSAFKSVRRPDLNVRFADTINDDQTIFWGKESSAVNNLTGGGGVISGEGARPENQRIN